MESASGPPAQPSPHKLNVVWASLSTRDMTRSFAEDKHDAFLFTYLLLGLRVCAPSLRALCQIVSQLISLQLEDGGELRQPDMF